MTCFSLSDYNVNKQKFNVTLFLFSIKSALETLKEKYDEEVEDEMVDNVINRGIFIESLTKIVGKGIVMAQNQSLQTYNTTFINIGIENKIRCWEKIC